VGLVSLINVVSLTWESNIIYYIADIYFLDLTGHVGETLTFRRCRNFSLL